MLDEPRTYELIRLSTAIVDRQFKVESLDAGTDLFVFTFWVPLSQTEGVRTTSAEELHRAYSVTASSIKLHGMEASTGGPDHAHISVRLD